MNPYYGREDSESRPQSHISRTEVPTKGRAPQTQHSLTHNRTKPSSSFTFCTKAISLSDSLQRSSLSILVSLPSCLFFSVLFLNNHATRSIQRAPHLAAHAWLGWIPQGSQRTPHLEAQEIARRMHPDTITNNQIIWMLGLQRGPTSEHP